MDTKKKRVQNFVGGEYVEASDGRSYELINPATGEIFAQARKYALYGASLH